MRIEFLGSIVLKNLYLLILFNLYLFIDWSGNPLFLTNLSRGSNINLNLLIRIFPGFQEDWLFPEIAQFRYKTSMRSRVEKGESFSRYDNPKKGNHIWNTFRKNKLILCNPLPNIKIERKFSSFLLFSPPLIRSQPRRWPRRGTPFPGRKRRDGGVPRNCWAIEIKIRRGFEANTMGESCNRVPFVVPDDATFSPLFYSPSSAISQLRAQPSLLLLGTHPPLRRTLGRCVVQWWSTALLILLILLISNRGQF